MTALRTNGIAAGLLLTAAWAPSAALAQAPAENSDEIIVTAEKRAESLQDVPAAISAYSSETLLQRQIVNIDDIQRVSPSVQVGFKIGGSQFVAIRGIGSQLYALAAEPAVAVTQDGVVYTSQNSFNLDLFDVERVEVLRGPQGTISGRNAIAGAINVISNRPTATLEGGLSATVGNYERVALEGFLSGPIAGDKLTARIAARADRDSGWLKNTLQNNRLGETDKVQLRASLLAQPSSDFEALLIFDLLHDRSDTFQVSDVGRIRDDRPSLAERYGAVPLDWNAKTAQLDDLVNFNISRYQPTLKATWTLSPSTELSSITGYVHLEYLGSWDLDGTSLPLIVFDRILQSRPIFTIDQFSQELTLSHDLSDRADLTVGGLYVQNHLQQFTPFGLPFSDIPVGSFVDDADQRLDSYAGYVQLRYTVLPGLRLSVGGRYTHDRKRYEQRRLAFGTTTTGDRKATWDAFTPRVSVDYKPSEDVTLYATVSKGFKSGGFVTFTDPISQFEPERVWNYEAGLKASWFGGRLRNQLSVFRMDYRDLQQSVNSLVSGDIIGRVINAEKATIDGVELELSGAVTNAFRFTFSGAWLDARYGELLSVDTVFPERGLQDFSGNRLVRAPEWQFSIGPDYTLPLGNRWSATLAASYAWQSRIYFDLTNLNAVSQPAYGILNLSASVQSSDERWRFSAFLKNATDEYYVTANVLLQQAGTPYGVLNIGEPRRFGASVAYRF